MTPKLSLRECVTLACVLEATAPKPGNVHRGADFDDVAYVDFLASAAVIADPLCAETVSVGKRILDAVSATQRIGVGNTNLGMVLLLGPLTAVPRESPLRLGIGEVLKNLTSEDAREVYAAIRLAQPGGLGRTDAMDVHESPPADLLVAMTAASDHDAIARQFVSDFNDVLNELAPQLLHNRQATGSLTNAIIHTQLQRIAAHGDSLIRRKSGDLVDEQARRGAQHCLSAGPPNSEAYFAAVSDFDFWLRADGRERNPGTTADLIAAALFACLREELLPPPWR